MLSERPVKIIDAATGQFIDAVVRSASMSDKVLWTRWHGEMPTDASDAHWDWDDLLDLAFAYPDRFETYALESNGDLQGLRMLEVTENDVEIYGVHALRLSTAPWNRPPVRRYSGVGSILVAVAIWRSVEFGHRGCIHCESLSAAESFHERNGMTAIGDVSSEELRRFRFNEESAVVFLDRLRADGLIS